jgi:NodT family efflux transporter outer membrane factor (OMF) lipoprotein
MLSLDSPRRRLTDKAFRSWLLLPMACAVLASCTSVPTSETPAKARQLTQYTWERSFNAPAGEWPTREWWTSFSDPQLDRLIVEALANAPSIAQADARVREARYRAQSVGSALWPSISATAAAQDEKLTYNGIFPADVVPRGYNWMGNASLDLSWEVDFWGKNRKAVSAAVSQSKAAQADAAAAHLLLAVAVARSYVQLQGFTLQSDIAADALRNRQASEALVGRRVAQGLDSVSNLEQATARVRLAEAQVAEVDESVRLTRNSLAALLGAGPDRALDVELPKLAAHRPLALPADIKADLLGRKPEIVAARWRAEAAAARVGVARAAFYPNVNLIALIGYQSLGLENLTNKGSDVGSAGAAIHLPLFEGGRLRAAYGEARAEYDLAVASYNEAVTQSLREIADAIQSLQALKTRLAATEGALARSIRAYELARKRYEGGLSDYQAVLTAEDALLATRNADNALRTRGYALDIDLVRALGGGVANETSVQ